MEALRKEWEVLDRSRRRENGMGEERKGWEKGGSGGEGGRSGIR